MVKAIAVERSSVKIQSVTAGWNIDAWCYAPTESLAKSHPVIIMAHGLSSNKLMSLSSYAEIFASTGYACIVFDYRRWGSSDGLPRNVLFIEEQLEDYRAVIKYARQQPEYDPHRVVLWGTSFSGGHVIKLASEGSTNATAVISQCPYVGAKLRISPTPGYLKTVFWALCDVVKQALGFQPLYIPFAAALGNVGVLTGEGIEEGVYALCHDPDDFPNQIAASAIFSVGAYRAAAEAASITSPMLIVAAENDKLCLLERAINVAQSVQQSELVKIPGAGHFDLYPGQLYHEASLTAQLEFLKQHVPV